MKCGNTYVIRNVEVNSVLLSIIDMDMITVERIKIVSDIAPISYVGKLIQNDLMIRQAKCIRQFTMTLICKMW